jgi:hypothetical protein
MLLPRRIYWDHKRDQDEKEDEDEKSKDSTKDLAVGQATKASQKFTTKFMGDHPIAETEGRAILSQIL